MSKVTVYRFRDYDATVGAMVLSPRWGTLDAIKAVHGSAILTTAKEVDAWAVDTEAPGMTVRFYKPSSE
jgi:hypothetical protein